MKHTCIEQNIRWVSPASLICQLHVWLVGRLQSITNITAVSCRSSIIWGWSNPVILGIVVQFLIISLLSICRLARNLVIICCQTSMRIPLWHSCVCCPLNKSRRNMPTNRGSWGGSDTGCTESTESSMRSGLLWLLTFTKISTPLFISLGLVQLSNPFLEWIKWVVCFKLKLFNTPYYSLQCRKFLCIYVIL